jgi:hypothetical protein
MATFEGRGKSCVKGRVGGRRQRLYPKHEGREMGAYRIGTRNGAGSSTSWREERGRGVHHGTLAVVGPTQRQ